MSYQEMSLTKVVDEGVAKIVRDDFGQGRPADDTHHELAGTS